MNQIPNIIPVLSGKGGVGKSSVTVQLALTLSLQGYSVGVLDIDLTGPSIPRLFGIEDARIRQAPGGWLPVEVHSRFTAAGVMSDQPETDGKSIQTHDYTLGAKEIGPLHCMSLGFLLRDRGDAVVWRGPKKSAMIGQLLKEVLWPAGMQFLLIDTPPGTSDEHIALATSLLDPTNTLLAGRIGAVVVTTPQAVSTADVRKELSFCQKVGLKVFGVIENMAGFVCECCGERTDVFSRGGGQVMAAEWGVPFLGSLPIDAVGWSMLVEEGKRPVYKLRDDTQIGQEEALSTDEKMVERYTSCSLYRIFHPLVKALLAMDPYSVARPSDTA